MSPLIESLKRLYQNNQITIEMVERVCLQYQFSTEAKEYILGGNK